METQVEIRLHVKRWWKVSVVDHCVVWAIEEIAAVLFVGQREENAKQKTHIGMERNYLHPIFVLL
jgi:hypothetical protein